MPAMEERPRNFAHCGGGSHYHFPVDPGLRRRTAEADPAASANAQRLVARGRNLCENQGPLAYLYQVVDSRGQTIDFLLSATRDVEAAKRSFRKALGEPHTVSPRSITVDKNGAYAKAVAEKKADGELWLRSRVNNILEQDNRGIERSTGPGLGFGSFSTTRRTLAASKAMTTIRKAQVRKIKGTDITAQDVFIAKLFGVAA
jgi:transposase, IS6 family